MCSLLGYFCVTEFRICVIPVVVVTCSLLPSPAALPDRAPDLPLHGSSPLPYLDTWLGIGKGWRVGVWGAFHLFRSSSLTLSPNTFLITRTVIVAATTPVADSCLWHMPTPHYLLAQCPVCSCTSIFIDCHRLKLICFPSNVYVIPVMNHVQKFSFFILVCIEILCCNG